jgi:hypothetical protein
MILPNKKLWLPGQAKRNPFRLNPFARALKDAHESRAMYRHFPPARSMAESMVRRMSPGYPCCCGGIKCRGCGTTSSEEAVSPASLELTFENMVNGTCSECTALNNETFILEQRESSEQFGACEWELFYSICSGTFFWFQIKWYDIGYRRLTLALASGLPPYGSIVNLWQTSLIPTISPCIQPFCYCQFENVEIPRVSGDCQSGNAIINVL